ncbi:hypothetical protein [Nocardia sp. NBC_01327]|nr:hypothetical protein OG326_04225 [Nocardia sp. NBC_01327]
MVAQVRGDTGAIVERVCGTVSDEERAVAARVLITITAGPAGELAHV